MEFDDALKQLHSKLRTGKKVQMSHGQFANMLKQFYDIGHAEGVKETKKKYEKAFDRVDSVFGMSDKMFKEADKMFEEADGLFADIDEEEQRPKQKKASRNKPPKRGLWETTKRIIIGRSEG